ncbi:MAG: hypothetical protein ACR2LL_13750 [Nitrosopumilus sp.]
MNKFFPAILLLAVIAVGSTTISFSFADEGDNSDREEKLEFTGTLEETLGHFWALEQNLDENNSELALVHATHPISELYDTMSEHLEDNPDFDAKLQQTLTDLQNKTNTDVSREDAQMAIEEAKEIIEEGRGIVVGEQLSSDSSFKMQLINGLLETAKVEYKEAVADGLIQEMAEFQDGSAFVWRSQQILAEIEDEIEPTDAGRINDLYTAVWDDFEQKSNPEDVEDIIDAVIYEFEELSGFSSKPSEHEEEAFGSDNKDEDKVIKEMVSSDSSMTDDDNNTLLSPLQQMKIEGTTSQDVTCKDGLELVFKFDGQPACVKPSSIEKLASWNWIQ